MLLKSVYEYKEFPRQEVDGKRHYKTPEGVLPSITTILHDTRSEHQKNKLKEWRNRVGDEEADRISEESTGLGSIMHENLEQWIKGEERPGGTNYIWKLGAELADRLIEHGLSNVSEVWGTEVPLYYKDKWSGTTDAVGLYRGIPSIIDFKTARKPKKRAWIEDYFMQGAAYAMAHNYMFDTDIKQCVIMMMTHQGKYIEFVCSGPEYERYRKTWIRKVKKFHGIELSTQDLYESSL